MTLSKHNKDAFTFNEHEDVTVGVTAMWELGHDCTIKCAVECPSAGQTIAYVDTAGCV